MLLLLPHSTAPLAAHANLSRFHQVFKYWYGSKTDFHRFHRKSQKPIKNRFKFRVQNLGIFFKNHDKSVKIFENRSKSLKTEAAAEVVVTGVMFAAEVKNRSRRQGYLFLSSLRVWYGCPNR
jgi:hypothetical protein